MVCTCIVTAESADSLLESIVATRDSSVTLQICKGMPEYHRGMGLEEWAIRQCFWRLSLRTFNFDILRKSGKINELLERSFKASDWRSRKHV